MYYEQFANYQAPKNFRSYRAIEQWVIRNLMTCGNCYMKKDRYYDVKSDYEKLFGKNNIDVRPDGKYVIVTINQEAKDKALGLVFY